jgi:hypothetical protein
MVGSALNVGMITTQGLGKQWGLTIDIFICQRPPQTHAHPPYSHSPIWGLGPSLICEPMWPAPIPSKHSRRSLCRPAGGHPLRVSSAPSPQRRLEGGCGRRMLHLLTRRRLAARRWSGPGMPRLGPTAGPGLVQPAGLWRLAPADWHPISTPGWEGCRFGSLRTGRLQTTSAALHVHEGGLRNPSATSRSLTGPRNDSVRPLDRGNTSTGISLSS